MPGTQWHHNSYYYYILRLSRGQTACTSLQASASFPLGLRSLYDSVGATLTPRTSPAWHLATPPPAGFAGLSALPGSADAGVCNPLE